MEFNIMATTVGMKHFSAVDYMQRLKKANFTDEQAEILAKETEELLSNVLDQSKAELEKRELATKNDLMATELRLIKWVLTTGAATILAVAGILKLMIH
jgi:hypothetical protein